jgi:hypothetical protein
MRRKNPFAGGREPGGNATVYHTHEWQDANDDWQYRELEFDFEVSPYTPGKLSGSPEDCYEAEGGDVEFIDVRDTLKATIEFAERQQMGPVQKGLYPGHEWIIHWPDGEAPDAVLSPDDIKSLEENAHEKVIDDAKDYDGDGDDY